LHRHLLPVPSAADGNGLLLAGLTPTLLDPLMHDVATASSTLIMALAAAKTVVAAAWEREQVVVDAWEQERSAADAHAHQLVKAKHLLGSPSYLAPLPDVPPSVRLPSSSTSRISYMHPEIWSLVPSSSTRLPTPMLDLVLTQACCSATTWMTTSSSTRHPSLSHSSV
jgi:hypothetical protein